MSPEQLQLDLNNLLKRRNKTKTWFWRVGGILIVGVAAWIAMYGIISDDGDMSHVLAVIAGAVLIWGLLILAFLLFRKLNKQNGKIRLIEKTLVRIKISKEDQQP